MSKLAQLIQSSTLLLFNVETRSIWSAGFQSVASFVCQPLGRGCITCFLTSSSSSSSSSNSTRLPNSNSEGLILTSVHQIECVLSLAPNRQINVLNKIECEIASILLRKFCASCQWFADSWLLTIEALSQEQQQQQQAVMMVHSIKTDINLSGMITIDGFVSKTSSSALNNVLWPIKQDATLIVQRRQT